MDFEGKPFIDYIPKALIEDKNEARTTIKLFNGSRMVLAGSNNFNSHMGTNPVTIINSEFSLHNPIARQYMNPILIQNGGIEINQYTPRGMNHGWDVLQQVRDDPSYYTCVLGYKDTCKNDGSPVVTDAMIARARLMGMSEETIRQEFECMKPETLIQTPNGSIKLEDIGVGDIVLSHSGRSRKVLKTFCNDYSGELISINTYGNNKPLELTPGHKVRVLSPETQTYEWVKPEKIKEGDYLCMPRLPSSTPLISGALVTIMAAYLSGGSFVKSGVGLSIGSHDEPRIERLINAAIEAGFTPKVYESQESVTSIFLCNTSLCDFLISECGSVCDQKRIPMHLISGHEELFYKEMMAGDGCETQERHVFVTTSISLAYGMQMLASTMRYRASIGVSKKAGQYEIMGRQVKCKESYQVQISVKPFTKRKGDYFKPIRPSKHAVGVMVRSVSRVKYSGKVHNIEVQHDNSYIAEGRAVHNCDFSVGNVGAFFTREMSEIHNEGRIVKNLGVDPRYPLHTVHDLGNRDAHALWIFQVVGNYIHLVHYFQESHRPMKYFVDYCEKFRQAHGCRFGQHFMPHDVKQETQGWEVVESRLMAARRAGFFFQITPRVNFADGIEQLRYVLGRCRFDKDQCSLGIRALREYCRTYDEAKGIYSKTPQEGWFLHGVDAMRYLAVNYRRLFETPQTPVSYSSSL